METDRRGPHIGNPPDVRMLQSSSASLRLQVTRFTTPLGRPASISSSRTRMAVWGVRLAAFRTNVFPVVMQRGSSSRRGSWREN